MVDARECHNEPSGSIKYEDFFISWGPVSFKGRTLLHGAYGVQHLAYNFSVVSLLNHVERNMKTYLIHLLVRFSKSHWRRERLAPFNGLIRLCSSYLPFHLKMKMDPVFQMLFYNIHEKRGTVQNTHEVYCNVPPWELFRVDQRG